MTTLSSDAIHVYRAKVSGDLDQLRAVLSPNELVRASSYPRESNREAFIYGRAMLRTVLGSLLHSDPKKINFSYSDLGKPLLANDDLRFNLSHAGNRILLAVSSEYEVGTDIESKKPLQNLKAICDLVLTGYEWEQFRRVPSVLQQSWFYRSWTLKEAVIKAMGLGIGESLQRFSLDLEDSRGPRIHEDHSSTYRISNITLRDLSNEDFYQEGLAYLGVGAKVSAYDWCP